MVASKGMATIGNLTGDVASIQNPLLAVNLTTLGDHGDYRPISFTIDMAPESIIIYINMKRISKIHID